METTATTGKSADAVQQAKYRAAHMAAGRCCGCRGAKEPERSDRTLCAACTARVVERNRVRLAAAGKPGRPTTTASAPENPVCGHCGGTDLRRRGAMNGRVRFVCRACGRSSYGVPKPPPPAAPRYPCPYCGGPCKKAGRDNRGRQRYYCKACRRENTRLWPGDTKPEGGPFRHPISLCLSLVASNCLIEYCNGRGLSPTRAVREIFRVPAQPQVIVQTRARFDPYTGRTHVSTREIPIETPPEPIPRRRKYLTGETTRARLRAGGRHHLSVLVVQRLTVHLDDLAYRGLLRFMRLRGLNHQDAARALIIEAEKRRRGGWE
jgi:hypothetical protein